MPSASRNCSWEKLSITGLFDISSIAALKEEFDKIIEQAERLSKIGFTGNEINKKLNLGFEDQEWRDHWWIPFNQVKADEKPLDESDDNKKAFSFKKEKIQTVFSEKKSEPNKELIWKSLIRQTEKIEDDFAKRLQGYFYKMRQDVLNNIFSKKDIKNLVIKGIEDDILFDIAKYNKLLAEVARIKF
ncbi:hypothetical protein LCGC14_3116080 [marine sediment metagenome]|uniref:Uncharacterized protein n=1 Tax=marine sediment metagenome TaxID=412755 RepID=A0A0F8YTK1_9ZZZZ